MAVDWSIKETKQMIVSSPYRKKVLFYLRKTLTKILIFTRDLTIFLNGATDNADKKSADGYVAYTKNEVLAKKAIKMGPV